MNLFVLSYVNSTLINDSSAVRCSIYMQSCVLLACNDDNDDNNKNNRETISQLEKWDFKCYFHAS